MTSPHTDGLTLEQALETLQAKCAHYQECVDYKVHLELGEERLFAAMSSVRRLLERNKEDIRRLATAAKLGIKGQYTNWANAGGVDECSHGYSDGIPCPKCDLAFAELILTQPKSRQQKAEPQEVGL